MSIYFVEQHLTHISKVENSKALAAHMKAVMLLTLRIVYVDNKGEF